MERIWAYGRRSTWTPCWKGFDGWACSALVGENELATLRDKALLERWQMLETLPSGDRERIVFVLDSLMRDAKTRQVYQVRAGL